MSLNSQYKNHNNGKLYRNGKIYSCISVLQLLTRDVLDPKRRDSVLLEGEHCLLLLTRHSFQKMLLSEITDIPLK